jgi:hypothetical protein
MQAWIVGKGLFKHPRQDQSVAGYVERFTVHCSAAPIGKALRQFVQLVKHVEAGTVLSYIGVVSHP